MMNHVGDFEPGVGRVSHDLFDVKSKVSNFFFGYWRREARFSNNSKNFRWRKILGSCSRTAHAKRKILTALSPTEF
jgi:hypothetical protein